MASCLRGLTRIPRTPFSLSFFRFYAEAAKKQETDRVVIPVIFRGLNFSFQTHCFNELKKKKNKKK